METHLTLMEQYSTKLQYMADNGLEVSGPDWVEFEYPGERAEEFFRLVSPSFADQESLVARPEILRGPNAPQTVAGFRVPLLEAIRVNRELLAREN